MPWRLWKPPIIHIVGALVPNRSEEHLEKVSFKYNSKLTNLSFGNQESLVGFQGGQLVGVFNDLKDLERRGRSSVLLIVESWAKISCSWPNIRPISGKSPNPSNPTPVKQLGQSSINTVQEEWKYSCKYKWISGAFSPTMHGHDDIICERNIFCLFLFESVFLVQRIWFILCTKIPICT